MARIVIAIILALILLPLAIVFLPVLLAALFTGLGMAAWLAVGIFSLVLIAVIVSSVRHSASPEGRKFSASLDRVKEKEAEKRGLAAAKGVTGAEYDRLKDMINRACNLPEDTPEKKKAKVKKIKELRKRLGWENLKRF